MSKPSTYRTLNFRAVQYAQLEWRNQEGVLISLDPTRSFYASGFWVRGRWYSKEDIASYHMDFPHETMFERAKRLDILDVWTPQCTFTLAANHCQIYRGAEAIKIYEAYRGWYYQSIKHNTTKKQH